MSYKKTIFFMFFIIILSSFALAQTQPTLFYGQILSGGNPIENIMISAEWIDDSSNTRFTKSSTLSKSQAQNMGQPYIYGFYSFTNGNIQAKPGTDIILSVEGIDGKVIMKTRPGSQPILINPIIIRQSSTQGSVLDGFKKAVGLSTETKTPGYYLNANGEEGVYKTYQKTGTKEKENDNYVRANENINENIQNKIPESSPNIQEAKTNLEALEITKVQETGEVDSKRGFNNISIFFMDFLKVIFLLLVLALIIGLLFLIYHYIIRNVAKKLSGISLDPVVNNTRRVFNIKVGDIAPQTRKISKNQEYTIALTNLVDYNTDTLFVVENTNYIGSVDEKNFLIIGYGFDKDLYDLKVEYFMSREINSILSNFTVQEAYFKLLEGNMKKLLVMDKGEIAGDLSLFDLQKTLVGTSRFYAPLLRSGLPTVKEIMNKKYHTIDRKKNVEEARKTMLKHNQNMILIYNEEKFVGIFTIRDYIVGLEKYQKNLFRHNVEGMMSTSIVSIKPDMNIFEANDFMVKNEYKNYPVIAGEKVLGILNQKDLCVKIFEYLEKKARKK